MKLPNEPMIKVYVCSPFHPVSEDPQRVEVEKRRNIERAQIACCFLSKLGMVPVAPHLFFPQFLDDDKPEERELGMLLGRELLCGCDELWAFGDRISEGMKAEIKQAKVSGIPVRYVDEPELLALNLCDTFEEIRQKFIEKRAEKLFDLTPKLAKKCGIASSDFPEVLSGLLDLLKEEETHES